MSSIKEKYRKVRETLELQQMPAALDILDVNKRKEFHDDYTRLVGRCGQKAMNAVLDLYVNEETIRKDIKTGKISKFTLTGHKNTSVIIARFVEEGLADYYLSPDPVKSCVILSMADDNKPVLITSFDEEFNYTKFKKDGIPKVFASEAGKVQSQIDKGILIAPEKIRDVFTRIDNQYNS